MFKCVRLHAYALACTRKYELNIVLTQLSTPLPKFSKPFFFFVSPVFGDELIVYPDRRIAISSFVRVFPMFYLLHIRLHPYDEHSNSMLFAHFLFTRNGKIVVEITNLLSSWEKVKLLFYLPMNFQLQTIYFER